MLRITLKAARVNAGYSQKSAAKALRISNKTLSRWESGESFPNVEKIKLICELYKITYDELIFLPRNLL